ncbi:MAG TPA: EamA family transporter [Deltaproteobacteria bacterium]|nr:EamA family transporter [Deltaproteobacteria bacterium]
MMSWYVLAVAALVLFGVERFLYKVSAERRCNTAWTTFSFMATVAIISTTLFFLSDRHIPDPGFLVVVSLINSASFFIGTISQIEALKCIPTNIAYPIIRLNTILVVLFSVIYFKDHLSATQLGGIIIAFCVVLWMTSQGFEGGNASRQVTKGLVLTGIALFSGAVAAISSKFAAVHTNTLGFIALSYIMGSIFSMLSRKGLHSNAENSNIKDAMIIGMAMGLVNLGGFYCFLSALRTGPLSIIISVVGMHFIVAIALSSFVYNERVSLTRGAGIALTVVALVLMR